MNHKAHCELGVYANVGAAVVVKPDGYVWLIPASDVGERVGGFFGVILGGAVDGADDEK